jgi:hypothetical protein
MVERCVMLDCHCFDFLKKTRYHGRALRPAVRGCHKANGTMSRSDVYVAITVTHMLGA